MSVFDGAVFDSKVFDTGAAAVTQSGGSGKGRKRRWAQIGDRFYHATDDEIAEILDAYVEEEDLPEVPSKPVARKAKKAVKKPIRRVPEAVPKVLAPIYAVADDRVLRLLQEMMRRYEEIEEEDIEMLLLH